MSKSVGLVILARLSSRRLPGKALKEIAGKKVLQHIVDRLLTVIPAHKIILACSDEASDDPLQGFCEEAQIACYRGSLDKVGERFYAAAQELDCDYAVRMNGDNIFLDPAILKEMMDLAATGKYRFLSNVHERTFPKGMSVEIVELDYYAEQLNQIKQDAYCNEHVMACLYLDPPPVNYFYLKNTALPQAAAIQLALDTPEDLERSRYMLEQMPLGQYDLNTTFEYYRNYEATL